MRVVKGFFSHPFGEWIIMIFALMAGFVAAKFAVSYAPDGGILGALKNVILAA